MKKLLAILMSVLLMTSGFAAAELLPLYEAYAVTGDGNAYIEVPNAYDFFTAPMSYTYAYIVEERAFSMAHICVFVHIPEGYVPQLGDEDVTGFAEDGRAVFAGADATDYSTVLERYEINNFPAVRVDMTGQGFEMIWIGDGGDLYFFMYPLLDATFAQQMRDMAKTFHLVEAKSAPVSNPADYAWEADADGVTITGYQGSDSRIAIPAETEGQPVTALADTAFYETAVRWVSIPDSVQEIGPFCFSGCTSLQTLRLPQGLQTIPNGMLESCFRLLALEIPDSVEKIGEGAFWGNFYLSEVRLPASLKTLGNSNFALAECLERFIVPEECTSFRTVDDGTVLLSGDGKRFIRYCTWRDEDVYTIPAGVESIASFAFADWGTLGEIIVPEGVTTVEGMAFTSLQGLERLVLPASAVNIGVVSLGSENGGLYFGSLDGETPPQQSTGVSSIAGAGVTIVAPEGSAAQAYAEQFQLSFEAAPAADEIQ